MLYSKKILKLWTSLVTLCALALGAALLWSAMQSKPGEFKYVAVGKTKSGMNISSHEHEDSKRIVPGRDANTKANGSYKNEEISFSKFSTMKCSNLPLVSPDVPLTQQWMPVILPSNDSLDYVFAAYLYTNDGRRRVVVTSMTSKNHVPFVCQIWARSKGSEGKVTHRITPCSGRAVMTPGLFKATLLYCTIKTDEEPFAVSIVQAKDPCSAPHNVLRIQDASFPGDKNVTVAVCVKPLYGSYGGFNRTARLVEFIEIYTMLGAAFFTMYAFDLNYNVTYPILKYYKQEKRLSIIPWHAPPNLKQFVNYPKRWYRDIGQTIAQTDCLYRSMRKYTHVAMVDIDEFLIPRSNMTFQKLFSVLPKHQGVYTFRNRFFRMDNNPQRLSAAFKDSRIRKYRPKTIIAPRGMRAIDKRPKYIALAKGTWGALTHRAKLNHGYKDYVVPVELGAMHHYRDYIKSLAGEYDPYMLSYKEEILQRMEYVFNETKAMLVN
ncbi:uncharacterized protein LOC106165113 [Lingula anatina]|uniref:Glycosyltransferase family 92 protein n=1 Tax=Lingula anatina TaxID=7574 RepID=A0A1S3IMA7_LINAN|nr:uncharacterized protein LOC106165113 [Lingula anatina]|eukprot:XP_013398664.1 uncharacterized protein LOC106165113 [Lingula anatina]